MNEKLQQIFRLWALLAIVFFVVAAWMGGILRLLMLHPVAGIDYRNFLHGHSHLAFLGWVFNALFIALLYAYLPRQIKQYRLLFWLLQVAVVGMLISFPIQGYAAGSITFSTLHIFLSYWFAAKFLKDISNQKHRLTSHQPSLVWVKWGLFFMLLSSVGPFALGAIVAKGLADSPLYQLSIYFYLHFQYNGWFTFAVGGLFFWLLERNGIHYNTHFGRNFLVLMGTACLPGFALSTLWTHPPAWIYAAGTLAAVAQVIALLFFIRLVFQLRQSLQEALGKTIFRVMVFAGLAFGLKIILQTASAVPAVAEMAYLFRNFTIGYLHLVFLGFVSIFLLGWFAWAGWIHLDQRLAQWGFGLFLAGFVSSEVYVVGQPLLSLLSLGSILHYYPTLLALSLLMPVGLSLMVLARKGKAPAERVPGQEIEPDHFSIPNQKAHQELQEQEEEHIQT
jgi:hypothetical protein